METEAIKDDRVHGGGGIYLAHLPNGLHFGAVHSEIGRSAWRHSPPLQPGDPGIMGDRPQNGV